MIRQTLVALAFGVVVSGPALADDGVTPEEVIAKVREAAAFLSTEGAAGLAALEEEGSPFVWADTYVFAFDCAEDVIMAHPVAASRGVAISSLEGADGAFYGASLCEAAEVAGGSWGEYVWPKPVAGEDGGVVYTDDAFRKVSYMLAVNGQPYQVGAGIYDEATPLDELNAMVPQ